MELSKQVVSRELAEKMKEMGFVQDSTFAWWIANGDRLAMFRGSINCIYSLDNQDFDTLPEEDDYISAYTVADLGEMLPKIKLINGRECSLRIWANDTGEYWYCGYGRNGIMEINGSHGKGKTLAEAMSKMLIYLAEQNLINPKEIKLWK